MLNIFVTPGWYSSGFTTNLCSHGFSFSIFSPAPVVNWSYSYNWWSFTTLQYSSSFNKILLDFIPLMCTASVGSKQCRACIMPQKQTTQWPMHLFEYLCHPYNNWLWHHFRHCASETVDTEQLGILPVNTQHPWMKPLSGMNGPLCHFGPPWNKPENTSELSHDDQTVDTPWRHADMAKAWACATNPLQEDCVGWHHHKDEPKSKKYFAVLGYPEAARWRSG